MPESGLAALVDPGILAVLERQVGGETLRRMVDMFTDSAGSRAAELERHADSDSCGRLQHLAHELAGSAGQLGLPALYAVLRECELACAECRLAEARAAARQAADLLRKSAQGLIEVREARQA